MMKVQLAEYKKLADLEREILAEIEDQQKEEYSAKERLLMEQLKQAKETVQQEKKKEAVRKLAEQVESGQSNFPIK